MLLHLHHSPFDFVVLVTSFLNLSEPKGSGSSSHQISNCTFLYSEKAKHVSPAKPRMRPHRAWPPWKATDQHWLKPNFALITFSHTKSKLKPKLISLSCEQWQFLYAVINITCTNWMMYSEFNKVLSTKDIKHYTKMQLPTSN